LFSCKSQQRLGHGGGERGSKEQLCGGAEYGKCLITGAGLEPQILGKLIVAVGDKGEGPVPNKETLQDPEL
jgi:hypothetical protein